MENKILNVMCITFLNLKIRDHTMQERFTCVQITISSDKSWNVEANDTSNLMAMLEFKNEPIFEMRIKNIINVKNTKINPSKYEVNFQKSNQIQSKLEWLPIDIIEMTLKKTKQRITSIYHCKDNSVDTMDVFNHIFH